MHSGNIIIAGFCCMVIFMSFLVYKCTTQRTDLVSENYYQQELVYQEHIEARKNAENLHFKAVPNGSTLVVEIPAELAREMTDASIRFYCPADKREDKSFALKAGDSKYLIDYKGWKKMHYTAQVSLISGGKKYSATIPVKL